MNIIEENSQIIKTEIEQYLSENYNEDSIEYQLLYKEILNNLNDLSNGQNTYDLDLIIYIIEEVCEDICFDDITEEEENTFYELLSDIIEEHIQYLDDNVDIEEFEEDY